VGWLEALARRKTFTSKARLVTVLELIATALQHERFQAAGDRGGDRARDHARMRAGQHRIHQGTPQRARALSHSAAYGKKANLVRALEGAMDEAADQMATGGAPGARRRPSSRSRGRMPSWSSSTARARHARFPLTAGGKVLGAIVLERPGGRDVRFPHGRVVRAGGAAGRPGPGSQAPRRPLDRPQDRRQRELRSGASFVGPGHAALKFWVGLAVLVTLFMAIVNGDYRITANATLEGQVQRAVTASIPGYVSEARARAGDIVKEGDLLAQLDDRDLKLERVKWASQRRAAQRGVPLGAGDARALEGARARGADRAGRRTTRADRRAARAYEVARAVRRRGRSRET
jgi:hypothetical protein